MMTDPLPNTSEGTDVVAKSDTRGTLPGGMKYQVVTDPKGQPHQAVTPVELNNLLSVGYSLPDGVEYGEAAEYLSANVAPR